MRECNRRSLLQSIAAAGAFASPRALPAQPQAAQPAYGYPMGVPGAPPGDGMYVRIAYAAENLRYYPSWWHTGENWHRIGDQTAGMAVCAVAAGRVVYAAFDYPGRVVIVAQEDGLYAMYGHLDYALAVEEGQPVARGQQLGTVLARSDDLARSHLHFELRTFYTRPEVNGDAPQYGVSCGYGCPPGPGYWPMAAPEHPSDLGWRNPTHVSARRAWPAGVPAGAEVVIATGAPARAALFAAPGGADAASRGDLPLTVGDRYPLLAIAAGEEASRATSAEGYGLWYRIGLPEGEVAWVRGASPIDIDVGSDGRPSSVRFDFLPSVTPLSE